MGTFGEMTLCSSFFFLVCILIENLALSKMPFRGDAVIGKCISPLVTQIVAFSSRTTSASKAKTNLLRWMVNCILLESVLKLLLRAHCNQGASRTVSPQKLRFSLLFQGLELLPQGT